MRLNSNPQLIMLLCTSVRLSLAAEITMELVPPRREVHGGGRIIDISHTFRSSMPKWGSTEGLGQFLDNTCLYILEPMLMRLVMFLIIIFDAGFDVDTLDLEVLNGPALLMDVPRNKNITGVRRVLFRTLNTDRKLMWKSKFDTSYVGFMRDGAKWLVENTDIKLVGVDYLSVAAYDDLIPPDLVFLKYVIVIQNLYRPISLLDVPKRVTYTHCYECMNPL
ncbi:hypothetical protein MKX01_028013 [Papaver californicum]|nr:hypothetical protein MKX01_028013 [Papaver californicum]